MDSEEKDREKSKKYDKLKNFEGKRYSGMKVGASHKWYYDKGVWRERKVSPDEWGIYFKTTKRRAGKAPKGTGAAVGTGYNWLIVAHQRVEKLDANSYMTFLEGEKFKVAHKRASKGTWNIKEKTQQKKVIQFLEKIIENLKNSEIGEEPFTVGEHERIYGLEQKNKTELYEIAAEMKIPNRSKMSRNTLYEAIKKNLKETDEE
ncbi:MAG TPA: Rho termination factor N-terminal domain-containing protein [Flavobacteriaceae bacterium]|nr:Rho termination factor N-terminal domain-containing protein [Flavobacteriaceae bacterium]